MRHFFFSRCVYVEDEAISIAIIWFGYTQQFFTPPKVKLDSSFRMFERK